MIRKKRRTIYIEPFDVEPLEPDYAKKRCELLKKAIHQIYDGKGHDLCLLPLQTCEVIHRNVSDMVNHKFVDKVYDILVKAMAFKLQEIATSVEAYPGTLFLRELHGKWMEHLAALRMIMFISASLDRACIPGSDKTPVGELGLNLWRDNIIRFSNVSMKLKDTLLEIVHKERRGEVIDTGLRSNIMKMLMDLGPFVYQQDFEKHFLDASTNFYRRESQELIECCDCGDYLKKTEKRLNEEIERVSKYLDVQSEMKITNVVKTEMIETHMGRLVHMNNSGLVNMILGDRDVMTSHIWKTGKQLVTDPERLKDPVGFVQCLLGEKDKHDKIIKLSFKSDRAFQMALNSWFERFINFNPHSPEYISLFLDERLRKGLKGVTEEAVNILLDKVLMLFRYLRDKNEFEIFYKEHLEKRLLSGKSVSDHDAERSLLRKLKAVNGQPFISNLEGIFIECYNVAEASSSAGPSNCKVVQHILGMGERAAESREMAKENYIVMHLDLSSFDAVCWENQAIGSMTTFCLKVPINTIVASEGGSGGALAIGCVNRMFVLENVAFCVSRQVPRNNIGRIHELRVIVYMTIAVGGAVRGTDRARIFHPGGPKQIQKNLRNVNV
ncbi:cullin-3A-like protein isoform X1 [Tanacetum coccineum]